MDNNTLKNDRTNQLVPLQRSTAVWQDEPGYGGTLSDWDQFGLKIDQLLKERRASLVGRRSHKYLS